MVINWIIRDFPRKNPLLLSKLKKGLMSVMDGPFDFTICNPTLFQVGLKTFPILCEHAEKVVIEVA